MHNLAIALKKKDYNISGSDDEIFEPAYSRLKKYGLLPAQTGWDPDKISEDIDAVILGMHARKDNPELLKAQALGLKIYSFPEYLYEQSQNKQRIVIVGSHGKQPLLLSLYMSLSFLTENLILQWAPSSRDLKQWSVYQMMPQS